MSKYTITPFHDDIEALYGKFRDCKYIFKVIGKHSKGEVNIITDWDAVEKKALVGHNNKYVYITLNAIYRRITVYNILDAFGYADLDVKVINQWNIDMEPVKPNDTILALSILETPRCLIMVRPKQLCGDGIDSDDYDSE